MDLSAWREENIAKRLEENNKKLRMSLVQIGERERERERSLKNFWKVSLNKSNSVFKKTRFTISNWSIQIEAPLKFLKQFWLIEKQPWSIKIPEKHNFEKTAQFLHKILQALKNMSKMHEYEMQSFSKPQVLNPVFPKLRFSNILLKFSSIKYVLHIIQGIFKLGWSNQRHTQLHVQCLAKSNLCSVWN